ncbi:MAG TPA: hypothetical protein ENH10_05700 [Bacteroidetes bacterium]|nr:hypothetical protein [Bacteroidota bacterium]HEX04639.1 hypothetical protein [Bacteroidota bacterium]
MDSHTRSCARFHHYERGGTDRVTVVVRLDRLRSSFQQRSGLACPGCCTRRSPACLGRCGVYSHCSRQYSRYGDTSSSCSGNRCLSEICGKVLLSCRIVA